MMKAHLLLTPHKTFEAIREDLRRFDLRRSDVLNESGIQVGDVLVLRETEEWSPSRGPGEPSVRLTRLTQRIAVRRVIFVEDLDLDLDNDDADLVILGLGPPTEDMLAIAARELAAALVGESEH